MSLTVRPGTLALALFVAAFGGVALLAWRDPLLARLAWREAIRRRGQSLLVVAGLMVGSAAIAAALVTSDSLGEAATINSHRSAGYVDLSVTAGGQPFPAQVAADLAADPTVAAAVQGVQAGVEAPGSVANLDRERRRSEVAVVGFDPAEQAAFGSFRLGDETAAGDSLGGETPPGDSLGRETTGDGLGAETTTGAGLAPGEVLVSSDLADALDAEVGDRLTVWLDGPGGALDVTVGGIAAVDGAGAYGLRPTVFAPLETVWQATGPDVATVVRITAAADVMGGIAEAEAARPVVEEAVARLAQDHDLRVVATKADVVEMTEAESAAPRGMLIGLAGVVVVAGLTLVVSLAHMLAEERRRQLGVLRALGLRGRGVVRLAVIEGAIYSLVAAVVGTGLGVLAGQVVARRIVVAIVGMAGYSDFAFAYAAKPRTVAVALASGALITLVTLALSTRRTARLSIVAAVRDLPEPPASPRSGWGRRLALGVLAVAGLAGLTAAAPPLRTVGGLAVIAVMSAAARGRAADRVRASLTGAAVVAWAIAMTSHAGNVADADPGPFFGTLALAVPATVFGLALMVVANLRLVEAAAERAGRSGGRLRATLRPPIAELSRRPTRTALTTGAFALALAVVATLATMSAGFTAVWEQEAGATDVVVSAPAHTGLDLPDEVAGDVARSVELPTLAYLGARERSGATADGRDVEAMRPVRIVGVPDHLDDLAPLALTDRGERYASDAQVWAALQRDPSLTVAAAAAIGERITLEGRDGPTTFTVIGHPESPIGYHAAMVSEAALEAFAGHAAGTVGLLELRPGVDPEPVAAAIERARFADGVEAMTFAREAGDILAAFGSLFSAATLLVRFALVVGLATLGILAGRAAVERRRAIGVLRAVGYRRRQILTGLLSENLTLATLGVVMGLAAGLTMGYLMLRVMAETDSPVPFAVDVPHLAGVALLVYAATAAVTVGPALRAAALPPAQAAHHLD